MFGEDFLQRAIIGAPIIFFSLTVHEFFHAWTALRFGDTTARDMGRLTLNPLAHLDFMGTVVMFLSQFRFGWAKPVPVNPMNLKNPRVADFWISFAGPLSNFGLGLIFGLIYRFLPAFVPHPPEIIPLMLRIAIVLNVSLAFFNLLPMYPLDGSHILRSILPPQYEPMLDRISMVAPFILFGLAIMGVLWVILGPPVSVVVYLFSGMRIR